MARCSNQKLKLLYILQILKEYTDEEHAITTSELISKLEQYGIKAERKTIYSDIEALNDFGYDILTSRQKNLNGYYMASREFELAELKFLVDATQSSKFITKNKSNTLIKKLKQFTSKYEANHLQRQIYVSDRVKTDNENIYINVDCIHKACQNDLQISFIYFDWTPTKEARPRKGGEEYIVSPWMLTFSEENYYLLAYDENAGIMKYYRVDKMLKIQLLKEKRKGRELMENFNLAAFSKKTFGMFAGKEELVTLLFENHLASVAIDRFGKEVDMRVRDEGHFSIRVNVCISNQFFGWLAGLSGSVTIAGPKNVRKEYREYIRNVLKSVDDDDFANT